MDNRNSLISFGYLYPQHLCVKSESQLLNNANLTIEGTDTHFQATNKEEMMGYAEIVDVVSNRITASRIDLRITI